MTNESFPEAWSSQMDAVQSIKPDAKTLVRLALEGESLILDGEDYTLHDLTQIAVALQPEANLAIRHAKVMSPIERASISTAGRGRITFL